MDHTALDTHLSETYGIEVAAISELDADVLRVDRRDGPSWVARVFPEQRPPDGADGDAAILQALERAGFPAERCAAAQPVSRLGGRTVLVTELVERGEPLKPGHTGAILAALLGRLHAHPASGLREGGAWHHLSFSGGPAAEIAAARERLEQAQSRVGLRELSRYHELCDAVERSDACEDLPRAFVHADFVPANAIPTADERVVVVDWAGAGRGPRLWSLGFLLWAAGSRSERMVEVVVSRYRRATMPEAEELERLEGAIRARPVMLEAWAFGAGRRNVDDALRRIREVESGAAKIATQARRAFATG
jgi:Ser/Thr protein kinase RdoA (MazF antagonist)